MKTPYQVGGTLPLDADTYITRQADTILHQKLQEGVFCYVLNSRQMGKSSLRVHTLQKLQKEGVLCADLDLTLIGTQQITPEEWYGGLVSCLVNDFALEIDDGEWWSQWGYLPPVQRFNLFIADILLKQISEKIVIFIDEIDNILNLEFKDDFFALIRGFYNQRANQRDYQRLTFCLLGVAKPADLIADPQRTPFNIGQDIELTGFQLTEIQPLTQGLMGKIAHPEAAIKTILFWTNGQPFLSQYICKMIAENVTTEALEFTVEEQENWLNKLIQSQIIETWDSQDEQEHFNTIRRRLLQDTRQRLRILSLYQRILQEGTIPHTSHLEMMDLRLTGLVVKVGNQLQLYNRIYGEIFNLEWVQRVLAELCPYGESVEAWFASGCRDTSHLLRGQILEEALIWAGNRSLGDRDYQFLTASQIVERQAVQTALAASKQEAVAIAQSLVGKIQNPLTVLQAVLFWTNGQPIWTQKLCQLVLNHPDAVQDGEEAAGVEHLVRSYLIQTWETSADQMTQPLRDLQQKLLAGESAILTLQQYQAILQQKTLESLDNTAIVTLLELGLILPLEDTFIIVNPLYQAIFNKNWVQKTLQHLQQNQEREKRRKALKTATWGVISALFLGLGATLILTWSSLNPLSPLDPPLVTAPEPTNPLILAGTLLSLILIYLTSKIGGEFCKWLGFPSVLGELIGGVILGITGLHLLVFPDIGADSSLSVLMSFLQSTTYISPSTAEMVFNAQSQVLSILAELGEIILLFEIGLQSELKELLKVGTQSALVALVGVILPLFAGTLGLMYFFHIPPTPALFAGAALTATSIGITSRVLSELKIPDQNTTQLNSPEGKIILGAAVLDDILAIIILTVVTSLAKTGKFEVQHTFYLMISASVFLISAIIIGRFLNKLLIKLADQLSTRGQLVIPTLTFALILSYIAGFLELEPILGAFTAGLIFKETSQSETLKTQIAPIADLLIPVFFVTIGAKANFLILFPTAPDEGQKLGMAGFLILVAILGKIASGFVVWNESKINKLVIGIGMMPRGEVGLVFVGVGSAAQVLPESLETAIVLMVIVTTFLMPFWLRLIWREAS